MNEDTRSNEAGEGKVMSDTLTVLLLGPMRMVTIHNRKSLRALEKSGHHPAPVNNELFEESSDSATKAQNLNTLAEN